ncbi:MAG: PIN/TRAM domain-containing protein [Limnochordia bacterium]|jgi:uncharacterized protein YacL
MKIQRTLAAIIGSTVGYQLFSYGLRHSIYFGLEFPNHHYLIWLGTISGALLGALVGPTVVVAFRTVIGRLLGYLYRVPIQDMIGGVIGLLIGLVIGLLVTTPLPRELPIIGFYAPLLITLALGYVGALVAIKKKEELLLLFKLSSRLQERTLSKSGRMSNRIPCKILDTSVIIDGRIADICRSGFLEGTLIVPNFILDELQHIADSSDVLKRNRGRRGLDILNKMRKENNVAVQIYDRDTDDHGEVDSRLVRLAKKLGAKIVTNDYNLNKVAELQGVSVLNINELANAVKPVVLPGEEMMVHVIKDGKEQGQGVAYLDDGTMIVVDGGRKYIGESVGVLVTSVLQTAAGRMIFAKPKAMERAL